MFYPSQVCLSIFLTQEHRGQFIESIFFSLKDFNEKTARGRFLLERIMGIEPTSTAWEAVVLPMNYIRVWMVL